MTRRALMVVALATCAMPACGEDPAAQGGNAPAPAPVVVEKPKKSKKKSGGNEAFTYSPIGLRDPFRSYLADLKDAERAGSRPIQETEIYELDQYRLTALITGTSQPKAMVEDPEGVGHVVRVGTRIGKNGGRVTRISAKGVVVVEEYIDPVGKRVRMPVTLALPQDDILTLEKRN